MTDGRTTPLDKRRAARKAAAPEIERLVKKYGRATIQNCLNKIREREKAAKNLADLRKKIAELEKRI